MIHSNLETELAQAREALNQVRERMLTFEQTVLNDQIKFLQGLLNNENNPDKMFALMAAIRGIEDYLKEL